jgi:HEAT repeat protein
VLAAAGQHLSLHDRSLGAVMALSGDDDPAVAATAMDAIDGIRTRDSILHAYGLAPQASSAAATMGKVMALTAATNRLAAELEAEIDGRDQVAQEKLGDAPVLVVARRLRSADEGERLLGCYDIGRLADGRAFPSLVQALSDPAASVRGAAVAAIARVAAEMPKGTNPARQPVPLQAIRHLALNANQAETRLAASRSLGRLEDQGIVPAFVERLRGAEINRAVQVAQIRALGRIGADIGLEALQDMVDRHPDERGLAAIDALAERKGWEGRALPLLVSTLDHESQRLRDAAEGALVRIAGDESMAGSGSAAWRQWLGAQGRP